MINEEAVSSAPRERVIDLVRYWTPSTGYCHSSSTTCVFQLKSLHADRPAVSVCNNWIYCGPKMSVNTRVRCLNVIVLDQGFANYPWFHLENLIFFLSFSIIFGRCCKESIILTVVQPYPVSLHIDYVLHVSFLLFWLIWDWLNSAEVHKLNGENTNKTSADQHYFSYFMLFYYQWYTLLYYTILCFLLICWIFTFVTSKSDKYYYLKNKNVYVFFINLY